MNWIEFDPERKQGATELSIAISKLNRAIFLIGISSMFFLGSGFLARRGRETLPEIFALIGLFWILFSLFDLSKARDIISRHPEF